MTKAVSELSKREPIASKENDLISPEDRERLLAESTLALLDDKLSDLAAKKLANEVLRASSRLSRF
jgi:hypothetical protein